MDEEPRTTGSQLGATSAADEQRSPEEIREDIDRTRAELGDTVEELAERSDVKAQARQRVEDVKARARQRRSDAMARMRSSTPESAQQGGRQVVAKVRANPAPVALAGVAIAGFLIGRRTGRD